MSDLSGNLKKALEDAGSSASSSSISSDEREAMDTNTRQLAIQEAETIIQSLETEVPEHLRDVVVARANDACSLAKSGKSPEAAICDAMKAIRCMNSTSGPCNKVKLLSCALERIRGKGDSFLKRVSIDANPCLSAKQKQKECKRLSKKKEKNPC